MTTKKLIAKWRKLAKDIRDHTASFELDVDAAWREACVLDECADELEQLEKR